MTMRENIIRRLTDGLAPTVLEVRDESHLHAGHIGARDGGETHYRVRIAAPAFAGQRLLACHRMVNALLAQELRGSIHALAIEVCAE